MSDEDIDLAAYRFSRSHEWVKVEDEEATVGISDYAQEQLGDVVAVELPEPGDEFDAGDEVALIDTVKKTEPIYTPVGGTITMVHEGLEDEPELINEQPYTRGWMFKVEMSDTAEVDALMDNDEYQQFIEEED